MITFNKNYFLSFAILFIVEVLIALYIDDRIIRPFVGDIFEIDRIKEYKIEKFNFVGGE